MNAEKILKRWDEENRLGRASKIYVTTSVGIYSGSVCSNAGDGVIELREGQQVLLIESSDVKVVEIQS